MMTKTMAAKIEDAKTWMQHLIDINAPMEMRAMQERVINRLVRQAGGMR